MKPKVSIVVPIYNVEQFLDRTMQSLLAQTLKDIEIIMVDDESPDNCPTMCDKYASLYPNVKVVHKKNAGLGMACNSGIEVATGEYIAFCDSDDYVDGNMYEIMYREAKEHDADAVYTGIKTVNEHGVVHAMSEYSSFRLYQEREKIHRFLMDMIASKPSDKVERHVPMSAKIALYRKALIDKYHLRFVSERIIISEDLFWNMDVLCHAKRVIALPSTFYYYYNNTSSLSKKVRIDRFTFFKTMREALIKRTLQYDMSAEALLRIDRMFIGYSRFYVGSIINSSLGSIGKRRIIGELCRDKIWKTVYQNYPVPDMPIGHRLMVWMMKNYYYSFMYLMYKIRCAVNICNTKLHAKI